MASFFTSSLLSFITYFFFKKYFLLIKSIFNINVLSLAIIITLLEIAIACDEYMFPFYYNHLALTIITWGTWLFTLYYYRNNKSTLKGISNFYFILFILQVFSFVIINILIALPTNLQRIFYETGIFQFVIFIMLPFTFNGVRDMTSNSYNYLYSIFLILILVIFSKYLYKKINFSIDK